MTSTEIIEYMLERKKAKWYLEREIKKHER